MAGYAPYAAIGNHSNGRNTADSYTYSKSYLFFCRLLAGERLPVCIHHPDRIGYYRCKYVEWGCSLIKHVIYLPSLSIPYLVIKKLFIALLLCACSLTIKAADQKIAIAISEITNIPASLYRTYSKSIQETIVSGFVKTNRFTIVDRSGNNIYKERELQKTENFIDGNVVAQGKAIGAEYIVNCSIQSYTNDGDVCKLSILINIVDVATGKIIQSGILDTHGGTHAKKVGRAGLVGAGIIASRLPVVGSVATYGTARTLSSDQSGLTSEHNALKKALKDIEPGLDVFVNNSFPISIDIAKILTTKNEGATSILVSGGSAYGLKEGDKFVVQKVEMLNGKPYPTDIAAIKVTKVVNEDFAECSVSKGHVEILSRFNAAEKLNCKLITNEK